MHRQRLHGVCHALILEDGILGLCRLYSELLIQVVHRGVAERSGLHDGDLITYIAGSRLPASPASVSNLVDVIKCGLACMRVGSAAALAPCPMHLYALARCRS